MKPELPVLEATESHKKGGYERGVVLFLQYLPGKTFVVRMPRR